MVRQTITKFGMFMVAHLREKKIMVAQQIQSGDTGVSITKNHHPESAVGVRPALASVI